MDINNKIESINKIIKVMDELNSIDNKMEFKYKKNCYEINSYKKILEETNDSFKNITKNLS